MLCLVATCCHAQNSSESLLLRIEEHQNKLRNWEKDNSRLLTTLAEKRKIYDNAIYNEEKLLGIVDFLVKKNMEVLQNVVSELNKIHLTMEREVEGEETLHDKEIKILDREHTEEKQTATNKKLNNVERDVDGEETVRHVELRTLARVEKNKTEKYKEVEKMDRYVAGDEFLPDKERSTLERELPEDKLYGLDIKGDMKKYERNVNHSDDKENLINNEDIGLPYDDPEFINFWYNLQNGH